MSAGSSRVDNAGTIRQDDEGERRSRLIGIPEQERTSSNGQIYWRGACDMKGGLAAAIVVAGELVNE